MTPTEQDIRNAARKRRVTPAEENLAIGSVYGRWTVEEITVVEKVTILRETHCVCRCQCGFSAIVSLHNLSAQKSTQCKACSNRAKAEARRTHDGRGSRLYRIWKGMKARCSPADPTGNYYDRGIRVCNAWASSFLTFRVWALANGYQEHLTIDRWPDQNGNYEPGNCRWATQLQQSRNLRTNHRVTAFGETKTASEWAEDARCFVTPGRLTKRLRSGWQAEKAITTAPQNPGRWKKRGC